MSSVQMLSRTVRNLELQMEELLFEAREAADSEAEKLHIRNGLAARYYVLRHCRERLEQNCFTELNRALTSDEVTEAGLHLNAYYLNIRGAIDNIAWALQAKFDLIAGATERSPNRFQIGLFGKRFLIALDAQSPACAKEIRKFKEWGADLAKFRDPAAHRIPLYVPPNVITTQEELDRFQQRNRAIEDWKPNSGGRTLPDLMEDALNVAPFIPVFCITTGTEITKYIIPDRLLSDHKAFLELSLRILELVWNVRSFREKLVNRARIGRRNDL